MMETPHSLVTYTQLAMFIQATDMQTAQELFLGSAGTVYLRCDDGSDYISCWTGGNDTGDRKVRSQTQETPRLLVCVELTLALLITFRMVMDTINTEQMDPR